MIKMINVIVIFITLEHCHFLRYQTEILFFRVALKLCGVSMRLRCCKVMMDKIKTGMGKKIRGESGVFARLRLKQKSSLSLTEAEDTKPRQKTDSGWDRDADSL